MRYVGWMTLCLCVGVSAAARNPVVGNKEMFASKSILENARSSEDHTTLVAAIVAAGVAPALKGAGPFTVFAPTNDAFDKLPNGTIESLLAKGNLPTLQKIVGYHVVRGRYDAATLLEKIKAGHGRATLATTSGGKLLAMRVGKNIELQDETGGRAQVVIADVMQSNGIIHVTDTVVLPK